MKCFEIEFSELAIDPKIGLKDYSPLYKHGIRLKKFLANKSVSTDIKSGRTPSRFNADYWGGDYEFLTMQDVDDLSFSLNERCVDKITDIAIEEEKTLYKARANALIVSNAMTLGLSFLTDREVYINQNVFEINLDESKINKKFALWYFNLVIRPLFLTTYTAKYLSKDELGRIKIPAIPKLTQDKIVAKIEPIERKIRDLKSQIKKPQEVINKVFAREFGFDLKGFEELKEEKFFEADFMAVTINKDLKFSVGNLRDSGVKNRFFQRFNNFKIKDISKEIFAGGDKPKVYSEEENEICKYPIFSNGKDKDGLFGYTNIFRVEKPCVTISARGTIGFSVARNEKFFPIVRLITVIADESKILNKYLEHALNFTNIERSGNTIAQLTTPMVENIKIPVPNIEIQQKIVDEIKLELDLQEQIKKQIEAERQKIDVIIEQSISS